jgi:hypothetical protein
MDLSPRFNGTYLSGAAHVVAVLARVTPYQRTNLVTNANKRFFIKSIFPICRRR